MRRIAHISDLHFGRHDAHKVAALLHSFDQHHLDLIVISGDTTQRARPSEFAEARHFLDRIRQPIVVVPGNHDVPLYAVHQRLLQPFAKFNRFIASAAVADSLFTDPQLAVLGLNTARRLVWKGGRVSSEQMDTMRRAFTGLPRDVWKVVVTHHPIASVSGEPIIKLAGRSKLGVRTVAELGVHLLLSGHHHQPVTGGIDSELVLNGSVLAIHAGTAVSTRTRLTVPNSYNIIELEPARAAITVIEWSEHAFRPARTHAYSFDASLGRLHPV